MNTLNFKAKIPFAPTTRNSFPTFPTFQTLNLIQLLALLIFLTVTSPYQGICQEPTPVDIENFYSDLSFSAISGDTLMFQLDLGNESNPAIGVTGFEITASLPKLFSAPNEAWASVEDSWLGVSQLDLTFAFDPAKNDLKLTCHRKDNKGQQGIGQIARIYLVREGGFSNSERILIPGGGIVMVDNIFKMAPQASSPSISVFPNPATTILTVKIDNPEGGELSLFSSQGALVWQKRALHQQLILLTELPKGIYRLEVGWDTGTRVIKTLLIN